MPEGPSMVIIKETITPFFKGKKIISARGNAKIDMAQLGNKKIRDIRTWGKQLFFMLPNCQVGIHFLLFGSYSMDEQTRPDRSLRLALKTDKHSLYFYTCSVRILPEDVDDMYDWEADVLSDRWNPVRARKKLKDIPGTMVCDALLDQQIFSGVGNIIKNEVLYRLRLHPETKIKNIPPRKLTDLVKEARNYSYDFLRWKKELTLKKHWQAYSKKTCNRCNLPLARKNTGKTERSSFYCNKCQIKYVS
jgi:endonuclease VIII